LSVSNIEFAQQTKKKDMDERIMSRDMMKIRDTSTPVVLLGCKIGALAIMRTLGSQGVKIYGVDESPKSPALRSRYLTKRYIKAFDPLNTDEYIEFLLALAHKTFDHAILIPTSDELSEFVAENRETLKGYFLFPDNSIELIRGLASKKEMFKIASRSSIPTPNTLFPQNLDDVIDYANQIEFPVMLKGIYGNRLHEKTGKKMLSIDSKEDLIQAYQEMEDPDDPNLMLQELIPGADDQVFIFNGYFDHNSDCLAAFTGYKVRQSPIHVGCASLGECRWNRQVAELTIAFMKAIGYRGILDIGYRLDPRDGRYKVLDVNPRVGQAFRIFVAENGMDVIRALYLDLTGQPVPTSIPLEGRRWMIEDYDFIFSAVHYYLEGSLTLSQWLQSFKNLEELAWFDIGDPLPFIKLSQGYIKRIAKWGLKRIGLYGSNAHRMMKTN
jgi:D-aspartate ligase